MKKINYLLLCCFVVNIAWSQTNITTISKQLTWKKSKVNAEKANSEEMWSFDGAGRNHKTPNFAWFSVRYDLPRYGTLNVTLQNAVYEPLDKLATPDDLAISDKILFENEVRMSRNDFSGATRFIPVRKTALGYEKLVRFELNVQLTPKNLPVANTDRGGPTENSVLKDGTIFKFAVENTGIQRIDAKILKDAGIDIAKIDAKKIKIYGNGGGLLPEANAAFRHDDLVENPCVVNGEEDGKFNDNDFILFYAVGADKWKYDAAQKEFNLQKNTYSSTSFYFIKIDGEDGKRITNVPNVSATPTYTSTSFNDFQRYEFEKFNLLNEYESAPGGGRQWFGDKLSSNKTSITLNPFIFANIEKNATVKIKSALAYRNAEVGQYTLTADNQDFTAFLSSCGKCEVDDTYAHVGFINATIKASSDNIPAEINVSPSGGSFNAWLDFVQMNTRRKLLMVGSQMAFRDVEALDKVTKFELGNASNLNIWNISDVVNPQKIELISANSGLNFVANTQGTLQEFIAFNPSATDLYKPINFSKVENQNLHALKDIEMLIIYPKTLESEALLLANHRKNYNGLKVAAVLINQVYNEFSSGALDPTGIRDFSKFLYEKNKNFKYLLLFGDGSFNYKGISANEEDNAKNFIPPYETIESLDPISTFPSDDYYALLSPNEGEYLSGLLDISVGRITASDPDMAKAIVDKIINYDKNPEAMRDYRNRIVLVTDDFEAEQDGSGNWETVFLSHSEKLAAYTEQKYAKANIEKAYLAAFPQVTTPGGQRSPDATEAINNNIFKGALFLNYIGHGGPRGWTQERILNANVDIPTWSNYERLPLFITATCSFAGYDSPADFTAGEQILALDKGGAVGLFSTVRAVYSNENDALTESVFGQIYKKVGYNGKAMGEILRVSKDSSNASSENSRKFTLLGDPSQRLMLPQFDIRTTKINGKDVSAKSIDTIGALQKLSIEGVILDNAGNILTNFNGKVYPTIYDKALKLKTVPIGTETQEYRLQNKVLFKGAATVKDGKFQFTCIIPKDINYEYGFGKISYYATNDVNDAAGSDNTHLVIGGVYKNAEKDDKGPLVEVFMDNEEFVTGGLVSANPTVYVKLSDDYGINVSGNSVGHDLTAVLDANAKNTYRLNDFYEAVTDNYAKGVVKYPLFKLAEGQHEIRVKAWDTANNPGEGVTQFVVASNGKSALEHVLNYPNPFTISTSFQFRHHLSEINLKVQVQIYTVSGKLVKTIETDAFSQAGMVDDVKWDGKDDFGNDIGKGVYIYKIKAKSSRNAAISEEGAWEKLVILK